MTTRTEGEVDDRHVVLYKLGYEPPEEEVQVDAQVRHRVLHGCLVSYHTVSCCAVLVGYGPAQVNNVT